MSKMEWTQEAMSILTAEKLMGYKRVDHTSNPVHPMWQAPDGTVTHQVPAYASNYQLIDSIKLIMKRNGFEYQEVPKQGGPFNEWLYAVRIVKQDEPPDPELQQTQIPRDLVPYHVCRLALKALGFLP
jgi:hypothetical protein